MSLGRLENSILDDILALEANDGSALAYVAWVENGRTEFGPCRWAYRNNVIRADGSKHDSWSVSPFPGAWTMITRDRIVRVRSASAL